MTVGEYFFVVALAVVLTIVVRELLDWWKRLKRQRAIKMALRTRIILRTRFAKAFITDNKKSSAVSAAKVSLLHRIR